MGVSSTPGGGRNLRSVTVTLVVILAIIVVGSYLYGPPIAPKMRDSAAEACNELTGGDYRDYQVSWHVGVTPNWVCRDTSDKDIAPVDLGWWVAPVN